MWDEGYFQGLLSPSDSSIYELSELGEDTGGRGPNQGAGVVEGTESAEGW